MVHCGYETSANDYTFGSVKGMFATVKAMLFSTYRDDEAAKMLTEESKKPHGPMVQLGISAPKKDETRSEELVGVK
jgi:hypothetical protein